MTTSNPAAMVAMYQSGKTVSQVAAAFGMSVGKAFSMLKSAECKFRKRGHCIGHKLTPEHIRRISETHRGKKMSDETKKRLSEAKRSKFNGLNGFGHLKTHCSGYVLAYAPMHPNAHRDGYVMHHTIVMERSLGRYLKPDEVVHHKNRIRNDNHIDNLELMNKREHSAMHMKERYKKG